MSVVPILARQLTPLQHAREMRVRAEINRDDRVEAHCQALYQLLKDAWRMGDVDLAKSLTARLDHWRRDQRQRRADMLEFLGE